MASSSHGPAAERTSVPQGTVPPTALAHLQDPVVIVDRQGRLAYLNAAAEAFFETSSADATGHPLSVLGAFPEPTPGLLMHVTRALKEEGEWQREGRLRLASGQTRDVAIIVSPIQHDTGLTGLLAIINDRTQPPQHEARMKHRLRVEQALTEVSRMLVAPRAVDFEKLLGVIGDAVGARSVYLVTIPTEEQPFRDEQLGESTAQQVGMGLTIWSAEGSAGDAELGPEEALPQNLYELLDSNVVAAAGSPTSPSAFAVPVLSSEDLLYGYLGIEHAQASETAGAGAELLPTAWQEEDVRVLQVLGDLLATYFERNHAMQALRESEERWRRLVESHPDPIVITQQDRIVYINRTGVEVLGAPEHRKVEGRSLLDFVSAELHEQLAERLTRVMEGETPPPLQHELIRLDGQERIVESYAVPILHKGQTAVQTVLRDITERVKTEQRYRTFVETISEGIWHADLDRPVASATRPGLQVAYIREHARLVDCNKVMVGFAEAAGLEQLEGRPMKDFLSDDGILREFVGNGYRLRNREHAVRLPDGGKRYFVLNAVGTTERGVLVRIWGSVVDVTERVRLERRMLSALEEQQQRIGRDLHDGVGQLMTGVRMLSQNLADTGFEPADPRKKQARRIAEFAEEASQHVSEIYRGLTPVQLHQEGLLAALDELAHTTDGLPEVTCTFDHDGGIDVTDHDATLHLYRIAQEATNNALKHADATHIRITFTHRDKRILLQVQDNGTGFDVNAKRSRSSIGLDSMVYRAHTVQADLTIDSSPGEGTTVQCRVPFAAAVPTDASSARS